MRSVIRKRADKAPGPRRFREGGFTLVEILIALAIASGSLILILSSNVASLKRSVQSRMQERLDRAAESQLAEWLAGIESAREGSLWGFDGHRWEIRSTPNGLSPLRMMKRVTLRVLAPDGSEILEWSTLRHERQEAR